MAWRGGYNTMRAMERMSAGGATAGLENGQVASRFDWLRLDKASLWRAGQWLWRWRIVLLMNLFLISPVLMHELRGAPEPTLDEQLRLLEPCDLVLIEGYKEAAVPKIEIHRPAHGKPPLWPENPHVVAVATDADIDCPLPRLPLNDPAAVAAFILDYLDAR